MADTAHDREYVASGYDETVDDQREVQFTAATPEEAVRVGLQAFPGADMIGVRRDDMVQTIWERSPHISLKFLAEGAADLDEVIGRLIGLADELRAMRDAGMTLEHPVDGGHVHLVRAEDR